MPAEHIQPSLSPLPEGDPEGEAPRARRRWWGHHLREACWQVEMAQLLADPVWRGEDVPHGDGAPVLAIPGFMAGDASLMLLRAWLERIGYHAYPSGIQFNVDCSDRAVDALEQRMCRIAEREQRSVALIGHSRGGHFAKALAHRRPELVATVISLGAGLDDPFEISVPTQAAVALTRGVLARTRDRVNRNGCLTSSCNCRFTTDFAGEFPSQIPLTSIYSPRDGVVQWRSAVVPYARCVEVEATHVGLGVNRWAYREIADTLAREVEPVAPESPEIAAPARPARARRSA